MLLHCIMKQNVVPLGNKLLHVSALLFQNFTNVIRDNQLFIILSVKWIS